MIGGVMATALRRDTLETIGLGNVLDIFRKGCLPAAPDDLAEKVFGPEGALVVSGAEGTVGAGKIAQLGARMRRYGVPIVALDMGYGRNSLQEQYRGLVGSFGRQEADEIFSNVTRVFYDGKNLPPSLLSMHPRVLIEAIPEILKVKKEHYALFRKAFPEIQIFSVTSGFPSSETGVGTGHPSFPHHINKVWEMVEQEPSDWTKLLWSIGLIPLRVADRWSFVLDVIFCGLMLAALRYYEAKRMPFPAIDKLVRELLGPVPYRAHDAIGGANFLTYSCLDHLDKIYDGELFKPTAELVGRIDGRRPWYPEERPMVNWRLDEEEYETFKTWILGPIIQMTSLMVHEKRADFATMNAIGELCAEFRKGVLALIRSLGPEEAVKIVQAYHKVHPEAAGGCWYPEELEQVDTPAWRQLYVNALHDGIAGVITISREALNNDVILEVGRAIDWLKSSGIRRVVLTSDFHLSTQMQGADISEFYPALGDSEAGYVVSSEWSKLARRLNEEFEISVGVIPGKRCLGGCLELMLHCHFILSVREAQLGFPEVTLPVVPGMEGCHWPMRRTGLEGQQRVLQMLLTGKPVRAKDAVGWLIDFAGSMEQVLQTAFKIVTGGDHGLEKRDLQKAALKSAPSDIPGLPANPARRAIIKTVQESCGVSYEKALDVQARNSAEFMTTAHCREGFVGQAYSKVKVS
jgi:enoyl-CoA hydratase/carnithine racemase/3-hydroxyacyl-CoA dehydrogenase